MKCYVTKYCLTKGVLEIEGFGKVETLGPDYICCLLNGYRQYFKLGRDVFLNVEGAEKDFVNRKQKKIKSLKKQIEKLEHLKFVVK